MADSSEANQRIQSLEAEVGSLREEVERLRKENRRWARLAGTDSLTGLPNKISFLRAFVPQVFQTAIKEEQPVGLILFSPDNLGDINETHGREAGDHVIKGLGVLVQSLVGDTGRLGHVDGSNFVVMMYPAGTEEVRGRANMVRARVRSHEFPCADSIAQITVSAGITSVSPKSGADLQSLGEESFGRLNAALHLAKKAGGNRVEAVTDPTDDGKEPG